MSGFLGALLLLLACGGGKPDETAASWSATLQMTAEKWAANSVPARFVRTTCDSAQKALEKAAKQSDAPRIKTALAAAAKLRDAAERGDREAAKRVAEELRRR
jgi:hypothetical protein